jgi:uncharacterized membrane protein
LSLESGKKLGYIASIINITVPVIMGLALIAFYAILFSSIFSGISSRTTSVPPFTVNGLMMMAVMIVGVVLALVGYILFMIAMHRLSKYYEEPSIFSNLFKELIIRIIFAVVVIVVVVAVVLFAVGGLFMSLSSVSSTSFLSNFVGVFAFYGVILLVSLVLSIYCALLYKRSFDKLAEKSGVDNFRTAGLLYLIGSIVPIVVWIAWIFASMGYRKLQPQQPMRPAPFTPPIQPLTATGAVKRCPACSTENSPDSIYCRSCGNLL